MMNTHPRMSASERRSQSGNIFFMLFASIALIGAMTAGAGNIVKGIVTSMSDVTRKTVAEEKMQGAARISVMNATTVQDGQGDCDADGMVEPLPYREDLAKPHPAGGGLVPTDIGATVKDPWGTEYGYCAWDMGAKTVTDNVAGCGGATAKRLPGDDAASKTVVAVISAGKDRKFSTTCNPVAGVAADCSGFGGSAHYNDAVSGHCYYAPGDLLTWQDAQSSCAANGGYLAVPNSSAEDALIHSDLQEGGEETWIGLSDTGTEGNWVYTGGELAGQQFWSGSDTGAPVGGHFNNWSSSNPGGGTSENCGSLRGAGTWEDADCLQQRKYVCELSPASAGAISKTEGSDDIVMEYTYNDANALSGDDLWKINDTKPGTAKISKDIDVAGGADLKGPLNLMKSGLVLPGDADTGACDATTDQQIRINFSNNPALLEICDFTGGNGWTAVSMGGGAGGCTAVGDMCDDGTVLAADISGTKVYTTPCDFGQTWDGDSCTGSRAAKPYNNGNTGGATWVGAQGSGGQNTALLAVADADSDTPGIQPHQMGKACADLSYGGHDDWILPNAWELENILYANRAAIGNFDTGFYGSSTETHFPGDNLNSARLRFADGYMYNDGWGKSYPYHFRCGRTGDAGFGVAAPEAPAGYVGYWRFDEGSGTSAADASGNNITGTVVDGTWVAGKNGGALAFDGLNGHVDLGTSSLLNFDGAMTFGAWVNLEDAGGAYGQSSIFFSRLPMSGDGIDIGVRPNSYAMWASGEYAGTAATPGFGSWQYVTMTIDGGTSKFYINGALRETSSFELAAGGAALPAYIGDATAAPGDAVINGVIDDVIVYDRALSADEVVQLFTSVGGDPADAALTNEAFLLDKQVQQCTSAGKGPFQKVEQSDALKSYKQLHKGKSYLYAASYDGGFSYFLRGSNGQLTRVTHPISGGSSVVGVYERSDYTFVLNAYHNLLAFRANADYTFSPMPGGVNPPGTGTAIAGIGPYILVSDTDALRAYTYDGTTFTLVGEHLMTAFGEAWHVWSDGRYIYLSAGFDGFYVLTFDGATFTEVAHTYPQGTYSTIVYSSTGDGKYLYLREDNMLRVFTFDGNALALVTEYMNNDYLSALHVDGTNIYATWAGYNVLQALRMENGKLIITDEYPLADDVADVTSDGEYIYVTYQASPMDVLVGAACNTGNNDPSGIGATSPSPLAKKLSVSKDRACAIQQDGSLWCWGAGADGALGNGANANSTVPSRVNIGKGFVEVQLGLDHGCAIDTDATMWCWGSDTNGQLGNAGTTGVQSTPTRVAGNRKWTQLSTGESTTCAVDSGGDAYCWGAGADGQLGTGSPSGQTSPALVTGGHKWSRVAPGGATSCGIDIQGQMWCWGKNEIFSGKGTLGTADMTSSSLSTPTRVIEAGPWTQVSAGVDFACGLKQDGTLWCWGNNAQMQSAQAITLTEKPQKPTRVMEIGPWSDVRSGRGVSWMNPSCGVKQDGTAWCWHYSYMGDGSTLGASMTRNHDPGPWATVQSASYNVCGMKLDGSVWCWGMDNVGQLGNGAVTGDQLYPVRVANFPGRTVWNWDAPGLAVKAAIYGGGMLPPPNIAMGNNTSLGYKAAGPTYSCAGLGSVNYTDPATGHCYFKNTTNVVDWDTAQATCAASGGYLAAITSVQEQTKLVTAIGLSNVWIGASDTAAEGTWIYTGGEEAGKTFWTGDMTGSAQGGFYNGWSATQPAGGADRDCAILNITASGTYWSEQSCTALTQNFLCEVGTGGARGGLSFPATGSTVLDQQSKGSELMLESSAANASTQLSFRAPSMLPAQSIGLDYATDALEIGQNVTGVTAWMDAITPQMQISSEGRVGIGVTGALNTKLEINGGLRIGADAEACSSVRAGTLRYVGGAQPYEYCNGAAWVAF